jgi:hypothetical protein
LPFGHACLVPCEATGDKDDDKWELAAYLTPSKRTNRGFVVARLRQNDEKGSHVPYVLIRYSHEKSVRPYKTDGARGDPRVRWTVPNKRVQEGTNEVTCSACSKKRWISGKSQKKLRKGQRVFQCAELQGHSCSTPVGQEGVIVPLSRGRRAKPDEPEVQAARAAAHIVPLQGIEYNPWVGQCYTEEEEWLDTIAVEHRPRAMRSAGTESSGAGSENVKICVEQGMAAPARVAKPMIRQEK